MVTGLMENLKTFQHREEIKIMFSQLHLNLYNSSNTAKSTNMSENEAKEALIQFNLKEQQTFWIV